MLAGPTKCFDKQNLQSFIIMNFSRRVKLNNCSNRSSNQKSVYMYIIILKILSNGKYNTIKRSADNPDPGYWRTPCEHIMRRYDANYAQCCVSSVTDMARPPKCPCHSYLAFWRASLTRRRRRRYKNSGNCSPGWAAFRGCCVWVCL